MIGYRKQNSVLQAGIKYQIWFFVCGVVVNLFTTVDVVPDFFLFGYTQNQALFGFELI